jgi:hypothetical protein
MLQVPAPISDTNTPETVQTAAVPEENDTAKPELAVAETVIWPVARLTDARPPKAIVCAAGFTVKLCVTGVAAR